MKRQAIIFAIVLILISYPIAELSRYIMACWALMPDYRPMFICELILMWLAFLLGVNFIAWRFATTSLSKSEDNYAKDTGFRELCKAIAAGFGNLPVRWAIKRYRIRN